MGAMKHLAEEFAEQYNIDFEDVVLCKNLDEAYRELVKELEEPEKETKKSKKKQKKGASNDKVS